MPRADTSTDQSLTALEHACRAAIGDRLRSVTFVSPDWKETVYRRTDLPPDVDEGVRKTPAATEDQATVADGGHSVVPFKNGYVSRIQYGDTEVIVTTDGIKMDRETELSAAVRGVLAK